MGKEVKIFFLFTFRKSRVASATTGSAQTRTKKCPQNRVRIMQNHLSKIKEKLKNSQQEKSIGVCRLRKQRDRALKEFIDLRINPSYQVL